MKTGIYKITNKINRKTYIGQSVDISQRWHYYRYASTKNTKSLIVAAIRKYGFDKFNFTILEECDKDELNEKEIYYIKYYKTHVLDGGYNLTRGGEHNIGEANPNAKLTKIDVLQIREIYSSKTDLTKREIYESIFKDKVGWRGFEKAWSGETWKSVNMSCYTKENKEHYNTLAKGHIGQKNSMSKLTNEEVLHIRERYVNETGTQIYEDYKDSYSYSGFEKILLGSTYQNIPVYKKSQKKWINK